MQLNTIYSTKCLKCKYIVWFKLCSCFCCCCLDKKSCWAPSVASPPPVILSINSTILLNSAYPSDLTDTLGDIAGEMSGESDDKSKDNSAADQVLSFGKSLFGWVRLWSGFSSSHCQSIWQTSGYSLWRIYYFTIIIYYYHYATLCNVNVMYYIWKIN